MYEAHVASRPVGEFGDKQHAIYYLSQEYNLDMVDQISLNETGICEISTGTIMLTRMDR